MNAFFILKNSQNYKAVKLSSYTCINVHNEKNKNLLTRIFCETNKKQQNFSKKFGVQSGLIKFDSSVKKIPC